MSVHPFPGKAPGQSGTIHVYRDPTEGYCVSHESASGNSWGGQLQFAHAAEAITAAYALNRDDYAGGCDVSVAAGVVDDANPGVRAIDLPTAGDF